MADFEDLLPPSLAWVPEFCESTQRALGQSISYYHKPTPTPLVYQIHIFWDEPIQPVFIGQIWNLFQKWASRNDCVPHGKVIKTPTRAVFGVIIKRRIGIEKNESP